MKVGICGECRQGIVPLLKRKHFRTNSQTNTRFSEQSAHYLNQSRRQSPHQNAKNLRKEPRARDPIPAGFRFRLRAVLVFYVYYPTDIYF